MYIYLSIYLYICTYMYIYICTFFYYIYNAPEPSPDGPTAPAMMVPFPPSIAPGKGSGTGTT